MLALLKNMEEFYQEEMIAFKTYLN